MTVAATGSGTMKSRFKSNNFIAILIAIFLIAAGFILGFIHKQSTAEKEKKQARQTSSETTYAGQIPASGDSLSQVALIYDSYGAPADEAAARTEEHDQL